MKYDFKLEIHNYDDADDAVVHCDYGWQNKSIPPTTGYRLVDINNRCANMWLQKIEPPFHKTNYW